MLETFTKQFHVFYKGKAIIYLDLSSIIFVPMNIVIDISVYGRSVPLLYSVTRILSYSKQGISLAWVYI